MGSKGVPLKDNLNTELYGSYTSLNPAYLVLVKYKEKKKILGIPIYYVERNKKEEIDSYIRTQMNVKDNENYKILLDKIPFNTIWENNNKQFLIKGYTEIANANELRIKKQELKEYGQILNLILMEKYNNIEIDIDSYSNQVEKIYNYILEIMKTRYEFYNNTIEKLCNIKKISTIDKGKCIKQMIIMMKANNSSNGNFKFLNSNLGDREGRMRVVVTSGKLIFKSTTGIKQRIYSIDEEKYEL